MGEQSAPGNQPRISIEMWSDLGRPWCYVGKHRLRAAIAQRPHADTFDLHRIIHAQTSISWAANQRFAGSAGRNGSIGS